MNISCANTCRNYPPGKHSPLCPDRRVVTCGCCGYAVALADLRACPECASDKCPKCDMGADVECLNCAGLI